MSFTKTAFIHSEEIERYHYPDMCPFKTERAGMTKSLLKSMGLFGGGNSFEAAPVAITEKEANQFHTKRYLNILKRISTTGDMKSDDFFYGLGTEETPVFYDLFPYSMLAAGATVTGARLLLEGAAGRVFNPSGGYHHALPEKAGGFCYINDIALGCKTLAKAGKRVLCLDLDAHHGNGTQHAFYKNSDVFTISIHESGKSLYPWGGFEDEIGEGRGAGYNVNIPIPPGTDDDAYLFIFETLVPPLIEFYDPDVIVCEIGMDILAGDPLTHLNMTNNVFAEILPDIMQLNKPMLVTGGGGYIPRKTARGWALVWTILNDMESAIEEPLGMGGVFLGSNEWQGGLRDMRVYSRGTKHSRIHTEIAETIRKIESTVFKMHKI
ncbi:MAG: acetoin utilization protein AcuC [Chitinivibrionales bacterium]|nr:acetoin utilization protein AcuC [Chitinivibrionales bacterium]